MALDGGGIMRKKILLKAPILTRSGYGEQSRFALRSLRTREDIFDIYIQPLQWGKTSWIALQDEERRCARLASVPPCASWMVQYRF